MFLKIPLSEEMLKEWKICTEKKPALILILQSMIECESEFYCQHQTT